MLLNTYYNTRDYNLLSARALNTLFNLYEMFCRSANLFIRALVLLVSFPVYFFVGVWLMYVRKKLQKRMRQKCLLYNDAETYVAFRKRLDEYRKFEPLMKRLSKMNPQKAFLLYRFFLSQVKKLSSTLVTLNGWMEHQLAPLNTPKFKTNNTYTFVPEQQLWSDRNPAYKYWM